MTLRPKSELRDVRGISQVEKSSIKYFLQGAVYCWVKNRPDEKFAARDLVGGENTNWSGTPMFVLYEKHKDAGKPESEAIELAGKDLGWLLKAVVDEDKRTFEWSDDYVKHYKWLKP